MHCESFGSNNKETILLLHGGGLGPWNYRKVASILSNDYHVVIPVLDGHAGCSDPFTSIQANAERIIDFINQQLGGSVLLMGGLSLGAQILVEILARQPRICRHALIESALVYPMKLTGLLVRPMLNMSYGLISRKWFSRLQFAWLKMPPDLFDDYFRDTAKIHKESMIAFLESNAGFSLPPALSNSTADVHIFAGQREMPLMKRSAKALHKALPGSHLEFLQRLSHGQFSLNHPEAYADTLRRILSKNP
ncbi:MAG: alpha/beta hydrolase [Clostridiales bacterium]|nr:alpha/beta hydrolase [Clostridiales bacterium]